MARCAESGEKDSTCPNINQRVSSLIVVCFVHVLASQTTRSLAVDTDTATFPSGATEKETSPPRLSYCWMQEPDSSSKTLRDPRSDMTTSRFGLINANNLTALLNVN